MMSVPYHLSVASPDAPSGPQNHRTVDRVTQILEEVTYRPGITFTELARALGAPKSSVHGFVRGLLAKGWLYEDDKRFYLGPAIYGLTMASGQMRAGSVTQQAYRRSQRRPTAPSSSASKPGTTSSLVAAGTDAHTASPRGRHPRQLLDEGREAKRCSRR